MKKIPATILDAHPSAYEVSLDDPVRAHLYLLIDPRDDAIRWIGKTVWPSARLSAHVMEAQSTAGCLNEKKTDWVNELQSAGLLPRMIIIQEGSVLEILAVEKRMIAEGLAKGLLLLNGRKPRGRSKKSLEINTLPIYG